MRKLVYTRAEGGVAVANLPEGGSEDDVWGRIPADAINPQWVDASAVPADRSFRNAWVQAGATIQHDIPKAREIARDQVRRERKPKLAALDVDAVRALEDGDAAKVATVKAAKQRLRDAPADARIAAANNVPALKSALGAVLAELE